MKSIACRVTVLFGFVLTISTFGEIGAGGGFATTDGPWTVMDFAVKVVPLSDGKMLVSMVSAHVLLL